MSSPPSLHPLAVRLEQFTLPPRALVFIAGLGGSGKSTLCDRLAHDMNGVVFRIDWYATYSSMERRARIADALASGDPTRVEAEENPYKWYSWDALEAGLVQLRQTGSLRIEGAWEQASGEKVGIHEFALNDEPIFCDGIYLLHEPIVDIADVVVLLDVDTSVARRRTEARATVIAPRRSTWHTRRDWSTSTRSVTSIGGDTRQISCSTIVILTRRGCSSVHVTDRGAQGLLG